MADITASTAFRDFIADRLTSAGGCYYYATLHTGATLPTAGSAYATSGIGEITDTGYTSVKLGTAVSGTTNSFAGTCTASSGQLDFGATAGDGDAIWNTETGETFTAGHVCLWVSTASTLTTAAKLVCMKAATLVGAGVGGYVKATFNNTILIPTPTAV